MRSNEARLPSLLHDTASTNRALKRRYVEHCNLHSQIEHLPTPKWLKYQCTVDWRGNGTGGTMHFKVATVVPLNFNVARSNARRALTDAGWLGVSIAHVSWHEID